ncbi:MAG: thymidylate kinase [Oscillospiraceae bacterium]|nr:thymidylate kinase [Oscillospiraceae bacterium]
MSMGKLIVIEGTDGCGKTTQLALLAKALEQRGEKFRQLDFPRYEDPSATLLKMYLDGAFGTDPEAVNPYAASTFFAVDRYASYHTDWKDYYKSGGVLLSNRYTTSNATHQGAKLPHEEREKFFKWLYDYEFDLLGIPAPDMVILLDVPIAITEKLMAGRREENGGKSDIHEDDLGYLRLSRESARHAAELLGWQVIDCTDGEVMRPQEEIHEDILKLVSPLLEKG